MTWLIFFRHGCTADRAAVYRSFSFYDRFGHRVAAGITAAAAVVARQILAHRKLFFIYFYFEFFADCDEEHPHHEANHRHRYCGDKYWIHTLPPFSVSVFIRATGC